MLSSLLPHQNRGFKLPANSVGFSATSDMTISTTKNWDGTIYYSTNGRTWTVWNGEAITGKTIYLKGENNSVITGNVADDTARWNIACDSDVNFVGDIENLRGPAGSRPTMGAYCYNHMFYNNTKLTTAPTLSATTLANSCYAFMFQGCTSLTTAPELPATTMASACYHGLFYNCTALTTPPALPATNLAAYCYNALFWGCTSLRTPPALPATTTAQACYMDMFRSCTALTSIPRLPATTLGYQCYTSMYFACSQLKFSTIYDSTTYKYTSYYFTGSGESGWGNMMFYGLSGAYTGAASLNTQYYCNLPLAS